MSVMRYKTERLVAHFPNSNPLLLYHNCAVLSIPVNTIHPAVFLW